MDDELIIEHVDLLYEVSEYAPKKLKDIEKTFALLKSDIKNTRFRQQLILQIKDFTQIPNVSLLINDELNAGMIPEYNKSSENEIKDFFNAAIGGKSYDEKSLTPEKLKKLKSVREPASAISGLYIFIGKPLIKLLSPAELVAVLLHEIGHIFSMTTNIPFQFLSIFKKILQIGLFVSFISSMIIGIAFYFYRIIALGLIYGITFFNRRSETAADRYAIKYGYGDELISVLSHFDNSAKPIDNESFLGKIKKYYIYIVDIFKTLLFSTDHPNENMRVIKIQDDIINKYKKLYPKYKDELNVIFSDMRKNREVSTV